jgi:hypothetical protein
MKSKIIIFISLITYILTAAASTITISSVETGTCKDNKYIFVIKANANGDLTAGSATIALTSPENTTPTCTYEAVTLDNKDPPVIDINYRRLAASPGDFDITCEITSKLDNVDIKVKSVAIGTITAKVAEGGVAMDGKATCEGSSASPDTTTPNSGKFIQISPFLFLLI